MKKLAILFISCLILAPVFSQDYIYKKDGSEIKAKVLEITLEMIKYKKYEFQNGPTYNIKISDVFMIVYENGSREVFKQDDPEKENLQPDAPVQPVKIEEPAETADEEPEIQPVAKVQKVEKVKKDSDFGVPKLAVGVTAGINWVDNVYDYKDPDDLEPVSDKMMRLAPTFGIRLDLWIMENFGIRTGALYKGKGSVVDVEETYKKFGNPDLKGTGKITNTVNYIEVPFVPYVGFSVNEYSFLQIGVGPYVAWGINGEQKDDYKTMAYNNGQLIQENIVNETTEVAFYNVIPKDPPDDKVFLRSLDYGLNIEFTWRGKNFMMSAVYGWGLANTRPDKEDDPDWNPEDYKASNRCSVFSLTYFFN